MRYFFYFHQGQGEPECGSSSRYGFHPHAASQESHDLPGNGKAQSRSPVFPGIGVVSLPETFEYNFQFFRVDADPGIADVKMHLVVPDPVPDLHVTLLGEFQGI